MREETHESLRRLFEEVIDLPPGERAACLDRDCSPSLRPRLEAMLAAAESDTGFLADPPPDAAPAFDPPERAGAKIGPFKLLEQIGEGGFGVVFLAEQREPVQRRVALKVIKLGMVTKAVIARFEAERQALALMDHQNIARVLEAGATETGRPYFVMELVKGEPVTRYCDALSLGIRERLELFTQLCHAVQHAHGKGVIHRDLKPSNILVSTQDGRPHAKVIDFGIAKATEHRLTERTLFTEHRALIGTPAYMSPEQAEGSLDIDTRSDVYALGVLLYELLTGATPFDAERLRGVGYHEIQRIIREEEPQKPSTRITTLATLEQVAMQRGAEPRKLGTLLRGDLDWIVMRSLEKDRSRRYETAASLAEDVQRHLAHEPVLAGPPSRAYRVRKFVRRNRATVTAAGLVAGTLLFGTAGTTFGLLRAEHRRAEAEAAREETQQVADFQSSMLNGIDVEDMGRGIVRLLREQVRAALERQYVGESPNRRPRTPEEISAELAAFDEDTDAAHAVDVARGVMDEFVLAPAAKALEEQFPGQPMVQADLHNAIGVTYYQLALYSAAEPHLTRSLALYLHLLGDDHEQTLTSANNVGLVLDLLNRFDEAEPYYRAVVDGRRRLLGDDDPETLDSIHSLAILLEKMGKFGEAEAYYREVLDGRQRVLGDDDPDTLDSIGDIGRSLARQNRMNEAEQHMRRAMDGYRCTLGDEDLDTLIAMNNLAALINARGRYAEAEPYFREVLDVRESVLGSDNPKTLMSRSNLGELLHNEGRLGEADECYGATLDKLRRALGDAHLDTLTVLNNVGYLLRDLYRWSDAEELFAEGTRAARAGLGDHPLTALLEHHHAYLLLDLGRSDEAIERAETAVKRYRAHPEWPAQEAAHALQLLTDALIEAGRQPESLEVWWEWIQTMRLVSDKPPLDVARGLASFGAAAHDFGDPAFFERAEQALRDCLEIRQAMLPDDSPDVWLRYDAMSLLGEMLVRSAAETSLAPEDRMAKLSAAEPLLLTAWQHLKDDPNVPLPSREGGDKRRSALARVVALYETWDTVAPDSGKAERVSAWRPELEKIQRP